MLPLRTWRMGEFSGARRNEIRAGHHAIASGINVIDTAEIYGEGGAEQLVSVALPERRR